MSGTSLLAPEAAHEVFASLAPQDAYRSGAQWVEAARRRLAKLLFPSGTMDTRPLHVVCEEVETPLACSAYEFRFLSKRGAVVARLFMPTSTKPLPLVICLQGHTDGMHISWGEGPERWGSEGQHFVPQILAQGFAALALEQRGFGRRSDQRSKEQARYGGWCHNPAMGALLYGHTLIGERVHDISVTISAMERIVAERGFSIDMGRIACMGHSGGGTASLYAACLESRIKAVMPAGAVCQFDKSIAVIDHCVCNYVPSIRRYFEMGDIAALVAPRPMVLVHGEQNKIFPIEGTWEAMETIERAYKDCSASDKLKFVLGPRGHEFYPEQAWPVFRKVTGW